MGIFHRTRILKVDPNHPEKEAIKMAAEVIKSGGLVAFPTETVYGLGAAYTDKKAVGRVYEVKKRPKNKPLTLHISDLDMFKDLISEIPNLAQRLISRFWPGPLTIILPSPDGTKIGFRMPKNRIALELIKECGVPVVAPSANLSGGEPARDAEEAHRALDGGIEMILDGGRTEIGIESTIMDATVFPCRILREGAISKARVSDAWHSI